MNATFFGEDVMEGAGKMEKWVNTLAVVTGVSSGIGATIAESLVKAGVNARFTVFQKETLISKTLILGCRIIKTFVQNERIS